MNDQLEKVSLRELLDKCITTPGYGDNVLTISDFIVQSVIQFHFSRRI